MQQHAAACNSMQALNVILTSQTHYSREAAKSEPVAPGTKCVSLRTSQLIYACVYAYAVARLQFSQLQLMFIRKTCIQQGL